MYSLGQGLANKKRIKKGRKIGASNNFSVGYLIIIALFVIFIIRAKNVINNYNDPGGYAYVQMLNFSMPVVKTQVYDEGAYVENNLSLKNVVLEAIGIRGINAYNIVGREIGLFSNLFGDSAIASSIKQLTPFSLKTESIARMTDEEIAELNKVSAAYDPSLKKTLDNSKIEVLIFHTHTTENYSERENLTTDTDFSIVGVGEVLAKELEEGYGISVIHDKTNHSVSYNDSYKRSNETLNKYMNEYGDFKLIIDLHRDGVDSAKATQLKDLYTINMNEQNLAKIMFVTGQNSERYAANKALVDELYNTANTLFPGIIRETYEYPIAATSINHSLSDNMVLLEVGANVNTAQEAKLSSKYIARIIAEHLNR
ncbi:stage II sporulation protein P [Clostridium sp. AL.422]|uniref:stage II sporulation protein P n=1 Tax=Clostridium TaxID=1485 RepID=UPI00293DFE53|nr:MULTISPECIES: stage II sporulation protein P [unclassified Clostridium]MDV4150091.1 stage II sporulation protein P [Clostridium sp. AL.422]